MARNQYRGAESVYSQPFLSQSDVIWIKQTEELNYRELGERLSVGRETARRWYLGTQTVSTNEYQLSVRAGGMRGQFNDPRNPQRSTDYQRPAPRYMGNPEWASPRNRQKEFATAEDAIRYLKQDGDLEEDWIFDETYFCLERRGRESYVIYFQPGK